MVRIAISVEGTTEEIFTQKVLAPYFEQQRIWVHPIQMGGDISISRVHRELGKLVHNFDCVTTMYDFYGFRNKEVNESKTSLEHKIHNGINENDRNKVIPYIQMYEFEGLLFSSPTTIKNVLQIEELEQWANDILRIFDNDPERINNSPQTAPSKRLISKVPGYLKSTHGPDIARDTGILTLREKCNGFNQWILNLESRAQEIVPH